MPETKIWRTRSAGRKRMLQPYPARIRLDLNLGLIVHGLEQVLQPGNRTDGRPDPIGLAGLDKGRIQRGDGGHQAFDAASRVGRAFYRDGGNARSRGRGAGIRAARSALLRARHEAGGQQDRSKRGVGGLSQQGFQHDLRGVGWQIPVMADSQP